MIGKRWKSKLLAFCQRWRRPALWFALALLASGCNLAQAPVLDPKGPITLVERDLLFTAFGLMLIVVVPGLHHGLHICVVVPAE